MHNHNLEEGSIAVPVISSRFIRWLIVAVVLFDSPRLPAGGLSDSFIVSQSVPQAELPRASLLKPEFVREPEGRFSIELRFGSPLPGEVTLRYHTINGTAMAGSDYEAIFGSLIFQPGETNKIVTVPILDDRIAEGDEVFALVLTDWTGAVLDGSNRLLVAIRDDEHPVVRDPTFTQTIPPDGEIQAMALQPDGKLLIAGSFFSIDGFPCRSIARLHPDGRVDRTFNPHFNRGIDGPIRDLRLLADGTILIVGDFHDVQGNWVDNNNNSGYPNVARLRPDGSFDHGFKTFSVPSGSIELTMLPGGDMLMAGGTWGPQLGRYFAGGTPDDTFRLYGAAKGPGFRTMGVQSDGRIIAGGEFAQVGNVPQSGLVRISTAAVVDRSFGVNFAPRNGIIRVEVLAIQPDDKILVAGFFTRVNDVDRPGLARLNPDGSLDASFDPAAGLAADFSQARRLVLLPNGGILWIGHGTPLAPDRRTGLVRLSSEGRIDLTCNPAADFPAHSFGANAAVVQPDGRIILGGGRLERIFATSTGLRGIGLSSATTNEVHEGDSLEVVVERLGDADDTAVSATLTIEARTANPPDGVLGLQTSVVIGPGERNTRAIVRSVEDGKAELREQLELRLGRPEPELAVADPARRVLTIVDDDAPSVVDFTFQPAVESWGPIAVQSDGKVLVAASHGSTPGADFWAASNVLWRLERDGAVDPSFQQTPVDGHISSITCYPDGRVLVTFRLGSRPWGVSVVRLHPDGSLDSGFKGPSSEARFVGTAIRPDGKVLLATSWGMVLLSEDGTEDESLPFGAPVQSTAFALQEDGKLVFHRDEGVILDALSLERRLIDGTPDLAFRAPFFTLSDLTGLGDRVDSISINSSGYIAFTGTFEFIEGVRVSGIARLRPDGTFDENFNLAVKSAWEGATRFSSDSRGVPPPRVFSVTSQADGKLLVLSRRFGMVTGNGIGALDPADSLIRLQPDGSEDSEFQFDRFLQGWGVVETPIIERDGNILVRVGGELMRVFGSSHAISRTGFVTNGLSIGESETAGVLIRREGDVSGAASVQLQATGRTAIEGDDFAALATTVEFAPLQTERIVVLPAADDPFAEPDETLMLTLAAPQDTILNITSSMVRLVDDDSPGSLDFGFVPPLSIIDEVGQGSVWTVSSLENGVLVAGLTQFSGAVFRFLREDGGLIADVQGEKGSVRVLGAVAPQGNSFWILDTVANQIHLREMHADGTLKREILSRLPAFSSASGAISVLPLADGKFLLFGDAMRTRAGAGQNVERLMPDGSVDRNFNINFPESFVRVTTALEDAAGRFLLGGNFSFVNGVTNGAITRVLADGSIDVRFQVSPGFQIATFNDGVRTLALQSDGRVLVGGRFASYNGEPRRSIARLLPDGSLDLSYDPGRRLAEVDERFESISQIALQSDGRAVVLFGSDEYRPFQRLARIGPDGTIERVIELTEIMDGQVNGFLVEGQEHILIWGRFHSVHGIRREGIARLKLEIPIRIHSLRLTPDNGISLVIAASERQHYVLENSVDLREWTPVSTHLATSARLEVIGRTPSDARSGYYRVRTSP